MAVCEQNTSKHPTGQICYVHASFSVLGGKIDKGGE